MAFTSCEPCAISYQRKEKIENELLAGILAYMEIIELTGENIDTYLEDCIAVQKHLVSSPESINSEMFKKTAEDTHSYFVGVIEDSRLYGMGVMTKMVHPVNVTGYINNIVLHPDARGKGLFVTIMDALEKKASVWGCTEMALTCSREAVQGMYEKRGYAEKKTNFYLLKI